MAELKEPKIIIHGVTTDGKRFRPSDWAERMSGNLSTYRNHRLYYSPMLQPTVKGGYSCVRLDPSLKQINPSLYDSILAFAEANKLIIAEESEE